MLFKFKGLIAKQHPKYVCMYVYVCVCMCVCVCMHIPVNSIYTYIHRFFGDVCGSRVLRGFKFFMCQTRVLLDMLQHATSCEWKTRYIEV